MTKKEIYSVLNRRFFLIFTMCFLFATAITLTLLMQNLNSQDLELKAKERFKIEHLEGVTANDIKTAISDLVFLSSHPEVHIALEQGNPDAFQRLSNVFLSFSKTSTLYDQIRLFDTTGFERIRINFNNGLPYIVADDELQNKGKRYYFLDTYNLEPGHVYVSPMDLNIENGQIEQPLKPMIRLGTPVTNYAGDKKGIVLLNYFASAIIQHLDFESGETIGSTMLLNSEGYWLKSSNPEEEWGFMYEDRKNSTLSQHDNQAWQKIISSETGQFQNKRGIYTYVTVLPLHSRMLSSDGSGKAFEPSSEKNSSKEYYWKIVSFIPASRLANNVRATILQWFPFYGIVVLFLAFISYRLSMAITYRLQAQEQLQRAHDELDIRVEERTIELAKVNEALQADIVKRKRTEETLLKSEEKFRGLLESAPDAMVIANRDGTIALVNVQTEAMFGYTRQELLGKPIQILMPNRFRKRHSEGWEKYFTNPQPRQMGALVNLYGLHKDGREFPIEISLNPLETERGILVLSAIRDITEKVQLEAQLRQSQKMEAIGQLAGGVAHDFNNLLTIILGNSELLISQLPDNDSLQTKAEGIRKAGKQASSLTRQLLVFSRKQVLKPKVMNLNIVVSEMEKMLRRLISEDIDLVFLPFQALGNIMADRGQIEQIIMNLAVNARDAMPHGGSLTIETANVVLDKKYVKRHIGTEPGPYAMLSVSDSGCGMDADVQSRIFEPFFTTKEEEKGTGLGLSTVYGIVKQSGGNIWVYSEPGHGTTFKIYLPTVEQDIESADGSPDSTESLLGSETVLLVEDNDELRNLIRDVLQKRGYTVLDAPSAEEAIQICNSHNGVIDLLLTDVVLPGLNGRDLAKYLEPLRSKMKVLYMSGYTDDAIVRHGVLRAGMAFLQKPFTPDILSSKVREVLGFHSKSRNLR
ncbi:MAG: PAS domain S-box protein [Thiotrichaceae bacterium]